MKNLPKRISALALIPCLLTTSVSGFALQTTAERPLETRNDLFISQAVVAPVLNFIASPFKKAKAFVFESAAERWTQSHMARQVAFFGWRGMVARRLSVLRDKITEVLSSSYSNGPPSLQPALHSASNAAYRPSRNANPDHVYFSQPVDPPNGGNGFDQPISEEDMGRIRYATVDEWLGVGIDRNYAIELVKIFSAHDIETWIDLEKALTTIAGGGAHNLIRKIRGLIIKLKYRDEPIAGKQVDDAPATAATTLLRHWNRDSGEAPPSGIVPATSDLQLPVIQGNPAAPNPEAARLTATLRVAWRREDRVFILHDGKDLGDCEVLEFDAAQQRMVVQPLRTDSAEKVFKLQVAASHMKVLKTTPELIARADEIAKVRGREVRRQRTQERANGYARTLAEQFIEDGVPVLQADRIANALAQASDSALRAAEGTLLEQGDAKSIKAHEPLHEDHVLSVAAEFLGVEAKYRAKRAGDQPFWTEEEIDLLLWTNLISFERIEEILQDSDSKAEAIKTVLSAPLPKPPPSESIDTRPARRSSKQVLEEARTRFKTGIIQTLGSSSTMEPDRAQRVAECLATVSEPDLRQATFLSLAPEEIQLLLAHEMLPGDRVVQIAERLVQEDSRYRKRMVADRHTRYWTDDEIATVFWKRLISFDEFERWADQKYSKAAILTLLSSGDPRRMRTAINRTARQLPVYLPDVADPKIYLLETPHAEVAKRLHRADWARDSIDRLLAPLFFGHSGRAQANKPFNSENFKPSSVREALRALDREKVSDRNALELAAAQFLYEHKDQIELNDLRFLAFLMAEGRLQNPEAQDWVAYAWQRAWPGLTENMRYQLADSVKTAIKKGFVPSEKGAGMLRPVITAFSEDEIRTMATVRDASWASLTRHSAEERHVRLRVAIHVLQARQKQTFVSIKDVADELGTNWETVYDYLHTAYSAANFGLPLITLSMQMPTALLSKVNVQTAVYAGRSSPHGLLLVEDLAPMLKVTPERLQAWGTELSNDAGLSFLFKRFGVLSEDKWVYYLVSTDPQGKPSDFEKAIVRQILEKMAHPKPELPPRTLQSLIEADYAKGVDINGHHLPMRNFYRVLGTMNDTGLTTCRYILERFDLVSERIRPADTHARAQLLEAMRVHAFDEIPWRFLPTDLFGDLVDVVIQRKHMSGLDVVWLQEEDFQQTRLPETGTAQKLDTGKISICGRLYHWASAERANAVRDSGTDKYTAIWLAEKAGRLDASLGYTKPTNALRTKDDLTRVLRNRWIKQIPWGEIPRPVIRELIQELAAQPGIRPMSEWGSKEFLNYPIPSFMAWNDKSGRFESQTLDGLYRYYAAVRRNNPDNNPSLSLGQYILREIFKESPPPSAGMAPHRDWAARYLELMKEGTPEARAEAVRLATSENEIPGTETDVYFRQVVLKALEAPTLFPGIQEIQDFAFDLTEDIVRGMLGDHTDVLIKDAVAAAHATPEQTARLEAEIRRWLREARSASGRTLEQTLIYHLYLKIYPGRSTTLTDELEEIFAEITRLHAEYNRAVLSDPASAPDAPLLIARRPPQVRAIFDASGGKRFPSPSPEGWWTLGRLVQEIKDRSGGWEIPETRLQNYFRDRQRDHSRLRIRKVFGAAASTLVHPVDGERIVQEQVDEIKRLQIFAENHLGGVVPHTLEEAKIVIQKASLTAVARRFGLSTPRLNALIRANSGTVHAANFRLIGFKLTPYTRLVSPSDVEKRFIAIGRQADPQLSNDKNRLKLGLRVLTEWWTAADIRKRIAKQTGWVLNDVAILIFLKRPHGSRRLSLVNLKALTGVKLNVVPPAVGRWVVARQASEIKALKAYVKAEIPGTQAPLSIGDAELIRDTAAGLVVTCRKLAADDNNIYTLVKHRRLSRRYFSVIGIGKKFTLYSQRRVQNMLDKMALALTRLHIPEGSGPLNLEGVRKNWYTLERIEMEITDGLDWKINHVSLRQWLLEKAADERWPVLSMRSWTGSHEVFVAPATARHLIEQQRREIVRVRIFTRSELDATTELHSTADVAALAGRFGRSASVRLLAVTMKTPLTEEPFYRLDNAGFLRKETFGLVGLRSNFLLYSAASIKDLHYVTHTRKFRETLQSLRGKRAGSAGMIDSRQVAGSAAYNYEQAKSKDDFIGMRKAVVQQAPKEEAYLFEPIVQAIHATLATGPWIHPDVLLKKIEEDIQKSWELFRAAHLGDGTGRLLVDGTWVAFEDAVEGLRDLHQFIAESMARRAVQAGSQVSPEVIRAFGIESHSRINADRYDHRHGEPVGMVHDMASAA